MVAITSHHSNLSHLLIAPQFHRIAGKGKDLSIKLLDGGSGSALGWCKRAVFFSFLGSDLDALIRSTKVEGFVMHHPKGPLQIVVCSSCFGDVYFFGGTFCSSFGKLRGLETNLGRSLCLVLNHLCWKMAGTDACFACETFSGVVSENPSLITYPYIVLS